MRRGRTIDLVDREEEDRGVNDDSAEEGKEQGEHELEGNKVCPKC